MTTTSLKVKKSQLSFSAQLQKIRNLPPSKPKNLEVRSREYLTSIEVQDLKDAARNIGRYGFRDWLLISMMYRHAFRVSEIIDMRWDQIDLKGGKLHVNRIKNGDPSVHYLEGDEVRALRKFQRDYPVSAFVFHSERGGTLTPRAVHKIIARAGAEARFEFPIHPHMLRHAKGYQLASKGIDTRAIQAYLGHKNIQHTVIYTKFDSRRFKGFGKD
jgi:type 1 fimbriae regulatory protein FimE